MMTIILLLQFSLLLYAQVWAFLVVHMVKNLSAMQETRVQSLGHEYPLEKGMLPTLVFFPGEFHGQRRLAGYSPLDHKESDIAEQLTHIHIHIKGLRDPPNLILGRLMKVFPCT